MPQLSKSKHGQQQTQKAAALMQKPCRCGQDGRIQVGRPLVSWQNVLFVGAGQAHVAGLPG